MSTSPDSQQTTLNCYLSTIVAIANCLERLCPEAGFAYRDRLLRLPRRLGFDPTPETLQETQQTLEAELAEFAKTAGAWIDSEAEHAKRVLEYAGSAADSIGQSSDLHIAMLNDLAEHMETSAEVDEPPQVRASLVRYAAGLRSYAKRKTAEDHAVTGELRGRTQDLAAWLARANRSNTVEPVTGLLNRAEALKQVQTHLDSGKQFCMLLFTWLQARSIPPQLGRTGADQVVRQIGERLVTLVRPYDDTFHWGDGQFAVIFETGAREAQARARQIAQWLSSTYSVVVDGTVWKAAANVAVTMTEPLVGELVDELVQRIDTSVSQEVEEPVSSHCGAGFSRHGTLVPYVDGQAEARPTSNQSNKWGTN